MKTESKKSDLAKWAVYFLILAVVAVLQSEINTNINFGIKLNILPYFLTAIAMYEHIGMSVAVSLMCGAVSDYFSPVTDGVFMLAYGLAGIYIWVVSRQKFRRVFPVFLILGSGALLAGCAGQYLCYIIGNLHVLPKQSIVMILGKVIYSAVFSPLIYFSVRKLHYKFAAANGKKFHIH